MDDQEREWRMAAHNYLADLSGFVRYTIDEMDSMTLSQRLRFVLFGSLPDSAHNTSAILQEALSHFEPEARSDGRTGKPISGEPFGDSGDLPVNT